MVLATFSYLAPLALYKSEKPYLSRLPSLPGLTRTNIVAKSYDVKVQEISGKEKDFLLDDCGFEFAKFPCEITQWSDAIAQSYYLPALGVWLEAHLKARVYIYAYNVCTIPENPVLIFNIWGQFRGKETKLQQDFTTPWKSPFFRVHCGTLLLRL
jgi:hypothetical protein